MSLDVRITSIWGIGVKSTAVMNTEDLNNDLLDNVTAGQLFIFYFAKS